MTPASCDLGTQLARRLCASAAVTWSVQEGDTGGHVDAATPDGLIYVLSENALLVVH